MKMVEFYNEDAEEKITFAPQYNHKGGGKQ